MCKEMQHIMVNRVVKMVAQGVADPSPSKKQPLGRFIM
jgi:hypothetical protein